MTAAVHVEALVRKFGDVCALDHVDLAVEPGIVFALLGPNGAGKTTLLRVLTTLIRPTSGRASIMGIDVIERPARVRELIGTSGQKNSLDDRLTALESLQMYGRLNGLSGLEAKNRTANLIERFGLQHAKDRPARTYSGGMLRKLDLAVALIAQPSVLILDEPTTGLDVVARRDLWKEIKNLAYTGTTIVLSTQYLEEADALADRVCVLNGGKIARSGTPAELKSQVGEQQLILELSTAEALPLIHRWLIDKVVDNTSISFSGNRLSIARADTFLLSRIADWLNWSNIEVTELSLRPATLDDVLIDVMSRNSAAQW